MPKVLETVFKISGTCIKAAWYGHSAGMNIMLRALASSDVKSSNYLRAVVGNAPGLLAPVNFVFDGFGVVPNFPELANDVDNLKLWSDQFERISLFSG